jgi:adenylate kinase
MGLCMLVAVTGTPGTGKTSVCKLLKGVTVIDLRALAEEHSDLFSRDKKRKSLDVDVKMLRKFIPKPDGVTVLDGHLSHHMKPDFAIVLRCSPEVLAKRLTKRRWSKAKIRENLEAEAVDVILIEAMDSCNEVFEIDTTEMTPLQVSKAVAEIIRGESGKYRPGNVDWSAEVMDWY